MVLETISGGDWLDQISVDASQITLGSYLTFGELASDEWNSQTYDPDLEKKILNFQSKQGSTIKFLENETDSEYQATVNITGKNRNEVCSLIFGSLRQLFRQHKLVIYR